MFRLVKYTLITISLYVIIINYNNRFFLYATEVISSIEIDKVVTDDYTINDGGSITITGNGYINGSVTKNSPNNKDVVNINKNYDTKFETGIVVPEYSTRFGTSKNKLSQINLNNSELSISNAFYANNLNINNGNLILNSGSGIDITNITKTSDSRANILINEDYSANTTFGISSDKIDLIIINNAANLTLKNNTYVNNLFLSDNLSSNLNLNSGSKVYGNIISNTSGDGTININTSYNTGTDTQFGNNTYSIGKVNIADENSLTLGNVAYIDNTELKDNSSLTLGTNSAIIGNVYGTGTVNIDREYQTTSEASDLEKNIYSTNFGNSKISLNSLVLSSTLTLNNDAYIDNLVLAGDLTAGSGTLNGLKTVTLKNNGLSITGLNYGNTIKTNVFSGNYNLILDGEKAYENNYTFGDQVNGTTNSLSNLTINSGSSLILNNNAYIDNLVLAGDLTAGSGTKFYLNNLDLKTVTLKNNGLSIIGLNYGNDIETKENVFSGDYNLILDGKKAYENDYTFGDQVDDTTNDSLSKLTINSGSSLILNNNAYINNLVLNGDLTAGSGTLNGLKTVTLENNGLSIIGLNYGNDIEIKKNVFSGDYNLILDGKKAYENDYTFGYQITVEGKTTNNSLSKLTINSGSSLILNNNAYIDNLVLDNSNSSLTLNSNSAVVGTIYGSGILNINTDYSTTDINTVSGNDTKIGSSSSSKIATVNVGQNSADYESTPEIIATLNLNNNAYVKTMNISNNSVLNINSSGSIDGTVIGSKDNQGIININEDYNTGTSNTIFGLERNRIKQINITNNEFTLSNSAYVNNFNITSNKAYTDTKRLFTMENSSEFTGSITLNKRDNDMLIGIVLNEDHISDLANLLSLINTGKNGSTKMEDENEAYLNLVNRDKLKESTYDDPITIVDETTGKNYSNAGLTYDGIYMDLKLQKSTTDLKLVVNPDRTPTLNDVSQATITSADVIDSWTFNRKSSNENILTANLQAISDKSEFFHAITNLTPDISGLNVKVPTQSIASAVGNIDKRLSYFRMMKFDSKTNNYNIKNLSKYDIKYYDDYFTKPYPENNIWMEAFAGNLHQDTVDNIFGYDANFYGATLGYDVRVNPEFVFGISYTFNQVNANDIDHVKSTRDDLKAMTNNADLYFMFYNKWNYLMLNVGGSYNKYNQERKIKFYNFDKTAKADYNGYSYYGGVEYGFNILLFNNNKTLEKDKKKIKTKKNKKFKPVNKDLDSYIIGPINNFIMLAPKISLTYNNIMIDDYTEKGADAANLIIKTKDYSSLDVNGGLALTLSGSLSKNTTFQTALNGFASYAIVNNKVELDARYVDDDEVFKVYGIDPPDLTYNLGISFSFNFFDKMDLGLSYNYMFGDGFNGMIGRITFLYAF